MLIPAIPSAAPRRGSEPLIPPPSLPTLPDPARRDPLPSLTLPPEVPVAPEKKPDSISRSSPLTRGGASGIKVKVFPTKVVVNQEAGYRMVGFYNHTTRDLELTIEGRSVKLPAKSYLYAQLGTAFTWSIGNRPSMRESRARRCSWAGSRVWRLICFAQARAAGLKPGCRCHCHCRWRKMAPT